MTILVLVALEEELPVELPGPYVKVVTGLGKVNAAIATALALDAHFPNVERVINFGTAGSLNQVDYPSGLHRVGTVYQRDMDCTPIGFDVGQTPHDKFHRALNLGVEGPSLSTGDNFVTSEPELITDLVDMEAYAIVKCCMMKNMPVEVYKYISDNANEHADEDWNKNVAKGYEYFLETLNITT